MIRGGYEEATQRSDSGGGQDIPHTKNTYDLHVMPELEVRGERHRCIPPNESALSSSRSPVEAAVHTHVPCDIVMYPHVSAHIQSATQAREEVRSGDVTLNLSETVRQRPWAQRAGGGRVSTHIIMATGFPGSM